MIADLIAIVELTHKFQAIKRKIWLPQQEVLENDAEHSYQLAFAAWFLITTQKLPLDAEKAMKYGLAHDLVEVHAGDVYAFEKDQGIVDGKAQREAEAAELLKKEYPNFAELHSIIYNYEQRADEESKFVYALDKLLAAITTFLDNGKVWKIEGFTLEEFIEKKLPQISRDERVKSYFFELVDLIKKDLPKYFPRTS
jgi:putative hydrolase of HD superfamily